MNNKALGNVTLTVEFEIHATSVREAEKWLDGALRHAEDDDTLKRYEVVKTEWESATDWNEDFDPQKLDPQFKED